MSLFIGTYVFCNTHGARRCRHLCVLFYCRNRRRYRTHKHARVYK